MARKGGFFRRPASEDEDESLRPGRVVKAKPIAEHVARRLGIAGGRDFVQASASSQRDFYGAQRVIDHDEQGDEDEEQGTSLTSEERNRISARILKAELKGDKDLVAKLRRELARGVAGERTDNTVLLMKTDARSGTTRPVSSGRALSPPATSLTKKGQRLTVDEKLHGQREIRDMVREEKTTTAHDQINMFSRAAKATTNSKTDDDWVVDDVLMSHKRKRRHEDEDRRRERARNIKEHQRREQTLDSCPRCIDSERLQKHAIVAVGLKTYLAVPLRGSLVEGHSCIVPMMHVASCLHLDEDVYDEMLLWRKGLVAMHRDRGDDCVFVETARNVKHQPHTFVECIPMPKEIGESAPIYFKKAIDESEGEWTDNRKLIPLRGTDLRRAIPKGFSYMAVDFGLQSGYAHVIENEDRFPANFAHEIIGGMLDLEPSAWRKPKQRTMEEEKSEVEKMKEMWKLYDWTERARRAIRGANEREEGEGKS